MHLENKNTISKVVKQETENMECPNCHCDDCIIKSGFTKNKVQRYLCKKCNKKFISTTNMLCYRTKLTFGDWQLFFECMADCLSIRKTAAKMHKNKNTVFAMRQKVLQALSIFRSNVKLSGEIQADEFSIPINFKGMQQSNMPRYSKKRKSAIKKVNHKICVLGAIDETDNQYLKIVGNGEITSIKIGKSLGPKIKEGTTLITDCRSAYESFAKEHNLKLEQIKSTTYKNENGYTLSEINGLHSLVNLKEYQQNTFKDIYIGLFIKNVEIINHPREILYYIILCY